MHSIHNNILLTYSDTIHIDCRLDSSGARTGGRAFQSLDILIVQMKTKNEYLGVFWREFENLGILWEKLKV